MLAQLRPHSPLCPQILLPSRKRVWLEAARACGLLDRVGRALPPSRQVLITLLTFQCPRLSRMNSHLEPTRPALSSHGKEKESMKNLEQMILNSHLVPQRQGDAVVINRRFSN
ncbi:hypothetical protein AAHE18_07G193600 [Arachis hypogaea]